MFALHRAHAQMSELTFDLWSMRVLAGRRRFLVTALVVALLLVSVAVLARWSEVPYHQLLVPFAHAGEGNAATENHARLNLQDGFLGRGKAFKGKQNRSNGGRRQNNIQASSSRAQNRRYVLSMNYWEQFSNAIRNFFSLACLVDRWDARVVKPVTAHSRLYGLKNIFLDDYMNSSDTSYDLDLILDPASMDSVLNERGLRSMSPLNELLRYGERKLTFLHFISVKPTREYIIKDAKTRIFLTKSFQESSIADCTGQPELNQLAGLVALNLNSQLLNVTQLPLDTNPFQLHKYFCINMTGTGLTPRLLASRTDIDRDNVAVVIINWRGTSNGSRVESSSKGPHSSNRIVVRDVECLHPKPLRFEFSPSVVAATERFMNKVGVANGEFMAVHFRSEKMLLRQSRFPRLLPNCVNEALQARDEMLSELGVSGAGLKILYFADVGTFGSETCKKCKSIAEMKHLTGKYRIKLSHFSPSDYKLPLDRGFVGAVEMSLMSHASHMILVGGGSFQMQLKMKFERNQQLLSKAGSKKKLVTLCASDQQALETTRRFSPPHS